MPICIENSLRLRICYTFLIIISFYVSLDLTNFATIDELDTKIISIESWQDLDHLNIPVYTEIYNMYEAIQVDVSERMKNETTFIYKPSEMRQCFQNLANYNDRI